MCSCFVSILEHALQTSASFCCNMSQPIMTYGWGAAKHPCPKAKHLWTSSEHLRYMEICFWLHRAIMIKGIQCQQKILKHDKKTKQTELSQHMDTGSSYLLLLHVFEAKSMRNATGACARVKTQTVPNAWSLRFKKATSIKSRLSRVYCCQTQIDPAQLCGSSFCSMIQYDVLLPVWQKGTLCLGHLNQTNRWNRLTKSRFSEVCLSWPEIHWNRKEMERSPPPIFRNMQGTMVQSANTCSFLSLA